MKRDPTASRSRSKSRPTVLTIDPVRPRTQNDEAVMLIHLSLEIACLTDIAQWHPVGGLLQELALASRGDSGLSTTDIARLRQWARRWSKLSGSLNKFYRNRAGHSAVGAALWYLLDDRDLPSGPTVGKLKALWSEEHGVEPWIDLLPRFRG